MPLCTVPQIVWRAPTVLWATIGCWLYTVEAPLLPVKGSLGMQSDSLITVLSFCFLSDSPLDSHVNMRTCTWYRLRSAARWKLSPPIPKVGSLYLPGFGQRHALSVTGDIVLLSAICEPALHGCSVEMF